MKNLIKLIGWDIVLLTKYQILPIAVGIGVLYIALIKLLDVPIDIVILLIFSDPSMMGFIFVGVMVLYEKQAGTTSALAVTPLQPWQYLLSKSISLSIPAIVVSMIMALSVNASVNYFLVGLAVVLTSTLFLIIGFVGAQRVKTFNQYILTIPMFLAPLCVPFIDFFGFWESPVMWLIPTHASLTLLKAAFLKVSIWKIIPSIFILLIYNALFWKWAVYEYKSGMKA